jgi:glycerophosphoryl diester phosphodiesterase
MKKFLKIFCPILAAIILFFVVINVIPPKKNVRENPFVVENGGLPMIAAHRGGGDNNPENTLLAFREAVNTIGVDIIESDLYITKDGYLVYNHDPISTRPVTLTEIYLSMRLRSSARTKKTDTT